MGITQALIDLSFELTRFRVEQLGLLTKVLIEETGAEVE